jgi:hypothetical protein
MGAAWMGARRATRVPLEGVDSGRLESLLTKADRWSRPGLEEALQGSRALDHTQVPPADLAPGWLQGRGRIVAGHQGGAGIRPAAGQHTPRVPLTPVNHGQQRWPLTWSDDRSRPMTAQWAQWAQSSKPGLPCDHRQRAVSGSGATRRPFFNPPLAPASVLCVVDRQLVMADSRTGSGMCRGAQRDALAAPSAPERWAGLRSLSRRSHRC